MTEDLFSRLFHSNPVATVLLRLADFVFIDVNDKCCAALGYAPEELLGRPAGQIEIWPDPVVRQELLERVLRERVVRDIEFTVKTKAGALRQVIGFFEVIGVDQEDLLLASFVDVTERKQTEMEIRKLAAFPELNPNPVLEFDGAGRVTYCNHAAVRLADAVEGGGTPERLVPRDCGAIVAECLRSGRPQLRVETRHGARTLSWSFYPIGRLQVVHCYVGDVTDRMVLEEQFRQAQKMEAVGLLAGGVAHDFNNLLTVIQMQISMIRMKGHLPSDALPGIEEIANAAERAANLTRQLLTFSRRQVKEARLLDPGELVGGMTRLLRRVLGEDVALENHFAPDLPPVHADPGMIEQVLMNLAVNARDAMPRGGRLTIALETVTLQADQLATRPQARAGRFVRLSVRDSGTGIAREHHARIFEPFFTTKEVGRGTGLGLAIVYAVARQHDGWVEFESEVGVGTTFHLFLPASTQKLAELKADAQMTEAIPGGSETILLVEDEAGVRGVARTALRRLGYTVLEAENAPAALRLWEQLGRRVNLLFTDIVMPGGMSGRELADRLRQQRPDLPVLFCSGYNRETPLPEGEFETGSVFLAKPYRAEELAGAVRRCLDPR